MNLCVLEVRESLAVVSTGGRGGEGSTLTGFEPVRQGKPASRDRPFHDPLDSVIAGFIASTSSCTPRELRRRKIPLPIQEHRVDWIIMPDARGNCNTLLRRCAEAFQSLPPGDSQSLYRGPARGAPAALRQGLPLAKARRKGLRR